MRTLNNVKTRRENKYLRNKTQPLHPLSLRSYFTLNLLHIFVRIIMYVTRLILHRRYAINVADNIPNIHIIETLG